MDPKTNYGAVSAPWWDDVWIVGGGPSAKSFDFSTLQQSRVLALNNTAIQLFERHRFRDTCVFSLDSIWIANNRKFLSEFPGEKYLGIPLETFPECAHISGVTYLQWCHRDGLSEDPHLICTGCNSGYGAINLATLKQAKTIHLVGYDMNPLHNDAYRYWSVLFRDTLPQLRRMGVVVLNHNPESFIDAYPKVQ